MIDSLAVLEIMAATLIGICKAALLLFIDLANPVRTLAFRF